MKFIKQWKFAVFVFVLFSLSWFFFSQKEFILPDSYVGKDISTILTAMPKGDKEKLEYFFRESIAWGCFGYVLLGEKPVALDVMERKPKTISSLWDLKLTISPRRIQYKNGYETWRKYEKFFPLSRFVFLYEEGDRNNVEILLINKKSFICKIEQHKKDFETILNREVDGKKLLDEAKNMPLFSQLFMNHDALIGMVLGFGRENAYFFHQKSQLNTEKEMIDFCDKFHLNGAWTDEEFEDFRKKFESVSWTSSYITGDHLKNLELMALPGFMADRNSEETQALRKHYLETKQAIIEYYKDKDFLEATLKILTSSTEEAPQSL